MKSRPVLLSLLALGVLASGITSTQAQATSPRNDQAPVIDVDSILPAAGWNRRERIFVSGTVSDDQGLVRVEYRVIGKKKWKKARLIRDNTTEDNIQTEENEEVVSETSGTFTFRVKASRKKYTRVMIRAIDSRNQESDYIVRRFRYDKFNQNQPDQPGQPDQGTTTPPATTPPAPTP